VLLRSIDARQRTIYVNLTIRVYVNEMPADDIYVKTEYGDVSEGKAVVVVGEGPAGLFASLRLIELGLRPIVVERGKDVHERKRDLAAITRNTLGAMSYKEDGKRVRADKMLDMERIISVGNISLSMFLGMAMISLRLWDLESLALPLIVILVSQVLMMALFVYIVAFPLLGRNYDAAVLCAGICGFGLGATPNAMANMSAVCYKYHYTVKPFLIIPIIGAMFADLINTGIISIFLNIL
jgi:threonine dehydrogenase-like Zn-dependent dehydrogenase